MDASSFIVLIVPFAILLVGWFILLHRLHRNLAKSSPGLFASLGKPSLLGRRTITDDRRLIQLISGRGTESIRDVALIRRLRFMRTYAIVMLAVFIGFVWGAAHWPAP